MVDISPIEAPIPFNVHTFFGKCFTLFKAFAQLHNKLVRLGSLSVKAPAKELDLALEEDLRREQWFASG